MGSEVDSPSNLTTGPIVYQTLVVGPECCHPTGGLLFIVTDSRPFEPVNLEPSAIVENEEADNSQCPS